MEWSDYKDEVKADAMNAIDENASWCDTWSDMYDSLFMDDSVTGNGSGSYYFNTAKAEDAISGIIFDTDAIDEFKAMGYDGIPTEEGAETCDVIARCIALSLVADDLEDYYNDKRDELTEEDD